MCWLIVGGTRFCSEGADGEVIMTRLSSTVGGSRFNGSGVSLVRSGTLIVGVVTLEVFC